MMNLLRIAGATALLALASNGIAQDQADREWEFRVLLDGAEIGTHVFTLDEQADRRLLRSEARFDVKFLFLTAYRYRHRTEEEWADGCLHEIDAETVANGKEQHVVGMRQDEHFVLEKGGSREKLPRCIMTFAYWNPAFLSEDRLLNPQTGEFLDVDVTELPATEMTVRGKTVEGHGYRVTAKDLELQVWYSPDREWLALESTARGGRKLRYELI